VETARIVAGRLGDPEFLVESWLACGMTPETCLGSLAGFAKFDHVMLVGHEPDFGEAVAACLGLSNPGALHIRKASLTAVEMPRLRAGAGRLEFSVSVRLM
jgi:phosphohistidine phosphatase